MTDWETNQEAYINLTQVNEIYKYNIIILKQNNERRGKAWIEYETLKWLVSKTLNFIRWDIFLKKTDTFTMIKWNFAVAMGVA